MVFMAKEVAKNGRTSRRHHRRIRAGDLAMATQLQTNGPGVAGAFQWLLHEVNLGQAKIGMNPLLRKAGNWFILLCSSSVCFKKGLTCPVHGRSFCWQVFRSLHMNGV